MKLICLIIALSILFPLNIYAHDLPDLGDVSQATITPHQERQIGLQIMRQIRADPKYLDDPEIAIYLSNLGHKLIANSDEASAGQSFEFFAVQDPTINAFALPGGFMGFNSGLIIATQSESELAAVMSHEIAHVTQKHLARMIAGQKFDFAKSIAALAVAIIAARANPQAGQAVLVASQASLIQSKLDFTRKHEKEADRIGLSILMDAGFDPQGMPAFFLNASREPDDFMRVAPLLICVLIRLLLNASQISRIVPAKCPTARSRIVLIFCWYAPNYAPCKENRTMRSCNSSHVWMRNVMSMKLWNAMATFMPYYETRTPNRPARN